MAAKITAINGQVNSTDTKEFLLTSTDEVLLLPKYGVEGRLVAYDTVKNEPCAISSTAMVVTGSVTDVYILTPDNEWTLM